MYMYVVDACMYEYRHFTFHIKGNSVHCTCMYTVHSMWGQGYIGSMLHTFSTCYRLSILSDEKIGIRVSKV